MAKNTSAIKPLLTDADTILLYDTKEWMMANCAKHSKKLMKINVKMHMRKAVSDVGMRLFGIGGYLIILFMGIRLISNEIMAFRRLFIVFRLGVLFHWACLCL